MNLRYAQFVFFVLLLSSMQVAGAAVPEVGATQQRGDFRLVSPANPEDVTIARRVPGLRPEPKRYAAIALSPQGYAAIGFPWTMDQPAFAAAAIQARTRIAG